MIKSSMIQRAEKIENQRQKAEKEAMNWGLAVVDKKVKQGLKKSKL